MLFFVLSGYLITSVLLQYRLRDVSVANAAAHFYWRRILRLAPPYYLALAIAFVLGLAQVRRNWWIHALYLTNVQVAYHGRWPGGADHFWTLSVEEHFYLLWFFAVVILPGRFLPAIVLSAFAVNFSYRLGVYLLHLSPLTTTLLPGNIATLAMGGLIAYARATGRLAGLAQMLLERRVLVATGFAFLLVSVPLPWGYAPRFVLYPLVAALFFACVVRIAAGLGTDSWFDWLHWAPLRHIGKISYGIYVYHLFLPGLLIALLPVLGNDIGMKPGPHSSC